MKFIHTADVHLDSSHSGYATYKDGLSSKICNNVIARVFRELNLVEQWGSGVRLMFREAEEQGLPEPEIMEVGMRLRVVVHLAQPLPAERSSRRTSKALAGLLEVRATERAGSDGMPGAEASAEAGKLMTVIVIGLTP